MEFLTQQTGILMPFAWILGQILNLIYKFFDLFGINNIAVCIVFFTIIAKMLMLPITIKQQKFTKLSSKMNPELTKINEKYKGKKDPDSMRRQQAETQEVYDKYGTNPMGGCLPMLITLPIVFALYRVIYKMPAYIDDVYVMYEAIARAFIGIENHLTIITDFVSANSITITNELKKITDYSVGDVNYLNYIIDIFSNFNKTNWMDFLSLPEIADNTALQALRETNIADIISVNKFLFGMSSLDKTGWKFPGVIIPVVAGAVQFLQGKLMSVGQTTNNNQENPAAQTMKGMNTIMPIMSIFICAMLSVGVGVYWIVNSVVQIIQQFFVNKYIDKVDLNEMIAKNVAKSNKKKAKLGVAYNSNKMANVAKTSTKSLSVSETSQAAQPKSTMSSVAKKSYDSSSYKRSDVSYKAGSIAANANLLSNRNSERSSASSDSTAKENKSNVNSADQKNFDVKD